METSSGSSDRIAHVTSTYPVITAIIIDGGFYLKRSRKLFGNKTPQ